VEPDRGGITYIPCDVPLAGSIRRLKTAGLDWTVRVKGKGPWVASVAADGRRLAGTWKVSPSALAKKRSHTVLIERGTRPPDAITLARAPWLDVRPVSASRAKAVFELSGWARSPVRIVSRRPVTADLDGRALPVRKTAATHTYEVEPTVRRSGLLTVAEDKA